MNNIAFEIDRDLAEAIGKRAADAGQTGSAWIAASLPRWLECDEFAQDLQATIDSLRRAIDDFVAASITATEEKNPE